MGTINFALYLTLCQICPFTHLTITAVYVHKLTNSIHMYKRYHSAIRGTPFTTVTNGEESKIYYDCMLRIDLVIFSCMGNKLKMFLTSNKISTFAFNCSSGCSLLNSSSNLSIFSLSLLVSFCRFS